MGASADRYARRPSAARRACRHHRGRYRRRDPAIPLRQESSPDFEPFEQPVIAHGKVRYVGEPIAVVLAESAAAAEDALDAITLDIEIPPRGRA